MQQRNLGLGVLLVVVGGVFLSTNGIMLRNIEQADGWQILAFRGYAFSIVLFLMLAIRYRAGTVHAFRKIGIQGLWAGLALGLGSCCYVFALLHTTIANAVFIIGASPIAAAVAGWLILGERMSIAGVITMLVSLAGVGLMFADGLIAGRWLGNIMALLVVASFVIYLLILRNCPSTDMLPATCFGGVVMALAGFLGAHSLSISTQDMLIALTMGCVQFLIGFMCFTIAARHILAAEVALFALTESILAPVWVWVGVGERPSDLTLAGSAIVLCAVLIYCVGAVARERRKLAALTATGST